MRWCIRVHDATLVLAVVSGAALIFGCNPTSGAGRVIIGRVENVVMQDVDMKLKGRIDSGAGVSSIDSRIIRVEEEDGDGERVVFELRDNEGKTRRVRRQIVDWIEIKGKGANATIRRPVVTLDICLGGKKLEGRFTLADRENFLYPVLVGRNILKTGDFLIDPKQKFMEHPDCS
jgi:hypothetical protein